MISKIINNIPTSGEVFQRIEENVVNSNSSSIQKTGLKSE